MMSKTIKELIIHDWDELSKELKLVGFTIYSKNKMTNHGVVIEEIDILNKLVELEKINQKEYKINALFGHYKQEITSDLNARISGFAAIKLNDPDNSVLLFYREEKVKVHKWAGKPNGKKEFEVSKALTPHKIFDIQYELVKNESLPWQENDRNFIFGLGNALKANILNSLRLESKGIKPELILENEVNELNYTIFLLQGEKKQLQIKVDVKQLQIKVDAMIKTVREAVRFNSLKSVVLSNMSHEMRTPLNGIMGLATLISESETASEETRHYGELIYKSGERMLQTFNRLMQLDLTSTNLASNELKPLVLKEFLEANLRTIAAIALTKGQVLKWHTPKGEVSIISNEIILSKILLNLVNNALNYSGSKAIVDVHAKIVITNDARFLRFTIKDNGPGIGFEELDKVFEPFYMSAKITSNQDKSSGLGLYIVKTYTEYLDGTIKLDSKLRAIAFKKNGVVLALKGVYLQL
ncbi:ATP-binding protein [Polaribacter sp. IC063]|uniref:sensor histidine kinase n=1 Tax=Polaribacter sp. IC063 TaxID=57031 RepID=UPI0011BDF760|nr:ATP-binding protein [Polaribacter sp. IC063]TXD51167.1 hypothetical protein ES043_13310 [Polaribacter sp. IC063]